MDGVFDIPISMFPHWFQIVLRGAIWIGAILFIFKQIRDARILTYLKMQLSANGGQSVKDSSTAAATDSKITVDLMGDLKSSVDGMKITIGKIARRVAGAYAAVGVLRIEMETAERRHAADLSGIRAEIALLDRRISTVIDHAKTDGNTPVRPIGDK